MGTINFEKFKDCVRGIAKKKNRSVTAVQAAIAEREETGVQINATQADAVRFHDDKSTYTGVQRVALFAVAWLLQQVHCHTILAGSTARVGLAFCQGLEAEGDVCALLALTKCTMDNRFVHNSGRSHGLLLAASAPEKWCGTLPLLTTREAVKTWVT